MERVKCEEADNQTKWKASKTGENPQNGTG